MSLPPVMDKSLPPVSELLLSPGFSASVLFGDNGSSVGAISTVLLSVTSSTGCASVTATPGAESDDSCGADEMLQANVAANSTNTAR